MVYKFIDEARQDIDNLYAWLIDVKNEVKDIEAKLEYIQPRSIDTFTLAVGTSPVPLSDVPRLVKRIHVKVPSWAAYLAYIGSSSKQDFVLEPGDKEDLTINDASKVYVRSLGNITIHVMLEE